MKLFVLAVRDRAADAFGRPFFVAAVGQGIRSFTDEVNHENKENQLYLHPEDFDLFLLGSYDDATGLFECDNPKQLAIGKDCKKNGNGFSN